MYSDATATQVVFIIDAPARSMDWSAFLCVVNAKVVCSNPRPLDDNDLDN